MSDGPAINHEPVKITPETPQALEATSLTRMEAKNTNEMLAHRAGEVVVDFFRRTSRSSTKIGNDLEDIHVGAKGLHATTEATKTAIRRLRGHERVDYRVGGITQSLSLAQRGIDGQIDATQREFPKDGQVAQLIDSLRKQEVVWLQQGGAEELTAELRKITQESDKTIRAQQIESLRQRILQFSQPISRDARAVSNSASQYREESKGRISASFQRITEANQALSGLREKLGDSYFRSRTQLEQAEIGIRQFRGRSGKAIEELPSELRLISNAADDLGITITELFNLMNQPQSNP